MVLNLITAETRNRIGTNTIASPNAKTLPTTPASPTASPSNVHSDIVNILLGNLPSGSLAFGQDPGPSENIIDAKRKCGTNSLTTELVRLVQT